MSNWIDALILKILFRNRTKQLLAAIEAEFEAGTDHPQAVAEVQAGLAEYEAEKTAV